MGFRIRLDQGNQLFVASGKPQIVAGDLVDREHRGGGTKLGAHIADRGAVCQRDFRDPRSIKFDEFPDHAVLTQHLGDGQHHIGGGHAGGDGAGQLKAHDSWNQHRHGLAQHGCFGFDAAHSPAQDPEAVDHGGV